MLESVFRWVQSVRGRTVSAGGRVSEFPDTFAMSESVLRDEIARLAGKQAQAGARTMVICQFEDAFIRMEHTLERLGVPFAAGVPPLVPDRLVPGEACLTLREAVARSPDSTAVQSAPGKRRSGPPCSVLVLQRHPAPQADAALLENLGTWEPRVQIGYFVSMDDPLMATLIPPALRDLMKTLGDDADRPFASAVLGRQVANLRRRSRLSIDGAQPARSAAEWLSLNQKSSPPG